ncbi:MAG: NAD(P)-dependent oxidoreductase [Bryobacteraceae bacterium]|jgi:nucleoside-diphosphate-sugar epimerase
MRVLLTGNTGQVGRSIAAHLVARGYEVAGASRRPAALAGLAGHVEVALGAADAVERIAGAIPACEGIVHAAAAISHDLNDPSISLVNCLGTQQIVKLAGIWGARRLIYISSVPVIGRPLQYPITEEHPVQPATAYHASKLYGEHLVRLAGERQCSTVSLRLTSPAGPGTPENRILAVFVRRALAHQPIQVLGRGTRRQNYVDVRDVAAAVEMCLRNTAGGVYNVAAAASIGNYDLARACIDALGSSSTVEYTGKPDPEEGVAWDVSIEKARRDFGYSPACGIADSILATAHECNHPG